MGTPLVVVGAGSAGCVIAARVTEREDREVHLLEAGPDYAQEQLPLDLTDGRHNSMRRHDWGYVHRPTAGQILFALPRGRVVGGSSAVNTCVALRGQPSDYDEWAALGLDEWAWASCEPAFKRLERDLDVADEHHGRDGPLPIRRHTREELVPWQEAFLEACALLGFPSCPDANAPNRAGYGMLPMNKVNGRRVSAAEAYLTAKVRARRHFTLRPDTLVRRILFRGRKVAGLELQTPRGVERLETDSVVLTAGAINTPALLVRSGVGPRRVVEDLGVTCVSDVPAIGARLLDHPGAAIFLRPRLGSGFRLGAPLLQTVLRYPAAGSSHVADMQLQPGSKGILPRFHLPLALLMCAVNKPRGAGTLRFLSADPRAKPKIESRLLEDPRDRAQAVEAMQLAGRFMSTPPMKKLAAPLWPSAGTLMDPELADRWVRRACDSAYHPSGTVPMGPPGDPAAATDGRGRVNGVEGLYVADASLMPTIPAANIHLAVLMLGERFGEWLREGIDRAEAPAIAHA